MTPGRSWNPPPEYVPGKVRWHGYLGPALLLFVGTLDVAQGWAKDDDFMLCVGLAFMMFAFTLWFNARSFARVVAERDHALAVMEHVAREMAAHSDAAAYRRTRTPDGVHEIHIVIDQEEANRHE